MDDKRDIIEELKDFKNQFTLNKRDTKKAPAGLFVTRKPRG